MWTLPACSSIQTGPTNKVPRGCAVTFGSHACRHAVALRLAQLRHSCTAAAAAATTTFTSPAMPLAIRRGGSQSCDQYMHPGGCDVPSNSHRTTWFSVQVWKVRTGQCLRKYERAHTQGVTSVSFSRDGTHVLSSSYDGLIRVHGIKSGKMLKELRGHTSYVNDATYSPDGSQVCPLLTS